MWTQIVGKLRVALSPPLNHWWHVPLYVTARGLTTSPIPYRDRTFEATFDFIAHRLVIADSDARSCEIAFESKSVAQFYRDVMQGLRALDIDVRIWPKPVEVEDAVRFDMDDEHATYDTAHAAAFFGALQGADRVLKEFQTTFVGKMSPVQFFWGSFDLAMSRYSGRSAPRHPGGIPNCPDWVMEESTSREEVAVGWWASNAEFGPAFYAYAYPEPPGYALATVPPGSFYDKRLGEFVLPMDAARKTADPDATVLEFLENAYAAAADLGDWDRASLEAAMTPSRPPRRAWTTLPSE